MTEVVVTQPIDHAGIDLLRAAGITVHQATSTALDELAPLLARADGAITRNWGFPEAALELAPNLRVISVHGTGTDRIARAAAEARGIRIYRTPGTNAQSVAEHALGMTIAAARCIPEADAATRAGDFDFRERVRGMELAGKTLGLWGYGRIAASFGAMARGIGMRVVVLSSHATPEALAEAGVERVADAADLLAQADVLSLHGVPDGKPLIGADELAQMRPGAVLVNTARGALVDEAALIAALEAGQLRAAALDVFSEEPLPADSPLCSCPNLLLTPHIGGSTQEALVRTSLSAAQSVLDGLGLAAA